MSRKRIPLLCYYDGRISHDSQGIIFEDVMPKATAVNRGIKYSDLVEKFYESIGIKPEEYKLMIICRYLANGKYIALPIHDDESVDIMLDMTKVKGINCVEVNIQKLYVFRGSQSGKGEKPAATGDPSMYLSLIVKGQIDQDYIHRKDLSSTGYEYEDGNEVFFRIKRTTPLRKLTTAYCQRQQLGSRECLFLFDARRLEDEFTPEEYNMKDGDEIDAMVRQRGD